MHKIYLAVLLLLAQCAAAQNLPTQQLTLEQAVQRALDASAEVHISREEVRRASLKIDETGALRYPRLDFLGQYLFTSEVMKQVQPPTDVTTQLGNFVIPGKEISFGDQNAAEFQLKITQPLFTGFALSKSHSTALVDAAIARTDLKRTRLEVSLKAEETYIKAQKAEAMVEVTRLQVETLQRHLQDAQKRVSEGVAPREFAARAEYALQQAELSLQQTQHGAHLAKIVLGEMLKIPADSLQFELDQLENEQKVNYKGDFFESALKQRLELESVRLQKNSLEERIGVQKAAYYPSLNAFGSVNYGRPGVDRIANEWMLYETAGVSLNWTLWDWNLRKARVEQVKVARRELDETYSALESRVRIEVSSAQAALQDAQRRFEVAEKGLKLTEDILGWVQTRYQQGAATETEYLDAQDDVSKSRLQLIIAQADCRLAEVDLRRACGEGLEVITQNEPQK